MDTRAESSVNQEKLYTMRELNQRTADVMREINESGKPALITRHGRIVAVITPLASQEVEARMVGEVLSRSENVGQLTGEHTLSAVGETLEVAQRQDVNLPGGYPDRDI